MGFSCWKSYFATAAVLSSLMGCTGAPITSSVAPNSKNLEPLTSASLLKNSVSGDEYITLYVNLALNSERGLLPDMMSGKNVALLDLYLTFPTSNASTA